MKLIYRLGAIVFDLHIDILFYHMIDLEGYVWCGFRVVWTFGVVLG